MPARMRPSRRWSVLLTAVVTVATLTGTQAPAAARPTSAAVSDACPFIGTVCLFEGENFTGERFTVSAWPPGSGACVSLVDHGWGDRAHSAINTNASRGAAMFMNDGCLGDPYQIPPNTGLPSFGGFTPESVWVP